MWDIDIVGGNIEAIARSKSGGKSGNLDAKGCLVTEPFVIAHVHLDKVMTATRLSSGSLSAYQLGTMNTVKSIKLAAKVKEGYSEEGVVSRARPVVEEALENGVDAIRAFADTDTRSELKAVRALMTLRDEFSGRVSIQVVAFPQEGIEADPGAEEYVEKAVEIGADVVGGIPWIEKGKARQRMHIDKMFAIARRHGKPIAMLVDDAGDPELRTLEMVASKTIDEGMIGRVQACHARAMQLYPESYARRVALLCKKAQIGVVSSPHTGPFHTRIDLLRRYGVNVALGQDDCSDAYYPYGRCNMLEVAFLASHILRKMAPKDVEELYDMITVNPSKMIGTWRGAISAGNQANLVVLAEKDVTSALASHGKPAAVIGQGYLLSRKEGHVPQP